MGVHVSIRMFEFSLSSLQSRCRMLKQVPRTDLMWTRPSMTSSESLGEQQLLCVCACVLGRGVLGVCWVCWGMYWVCVLRVYTRWECDGRVLAGVLGVCAGCVCWGCVLGVCWVCVLRVYARWECDGRVLGVCAGCVCWGCAGCVLFLGHIPALLS